MYNNHERSYNSASVIELLDEPRQYTKNDKVLHLINFDEISDKEFEQILNSLTPQEIFDSLFSEEFWSVFRHEEKHPEEEELPPPPMIAPYNTESIQKSALINVSNTAPSWNSENCSPISNLDPEKNFDPNYFVIHDVSKSKTRAPKLREFLQLVLSNPLYVSYASWIKIDDGLFKIHEPEKLALLWQRVKVRKGGQVMNYENFSRSIRYYYRLGAMKKTHTKHIYCFGKQ